MSRFVEVIRRAADNPVEAIQVVVAIFAFVISAFVISPFFTPEASPSLEAAFPMIIIGKIVFFILVMLPSIPTLLSLFMKRFQTITWQSRSAFFMFIGYLFIVFLRLVTVGPYPIVWLPTLAIALIMAICWAYWKRRA